MRKKQKQKKNLCVANKITILELRQSVVNKEYIAIHSTLCIFTNEAKQWGHLKTIQLSANRYAIIGPFA